jgi:hypothetical protein
MLSVLVFLKNYKNNIQVSRVPIKVFEETAGLLKLVIYEFISSYIKI